MLGAGRVSLRECDESVSRRTTTAGRRSVHEQSGGKSHLGRDGGGSGGADTDGSENVDFAGTKS